MDGPQRVTAEQSICNYENSLSSVQTLFSKPSEALTCSNTHDRYLIRKVRGKTAMVGQDA